MATTDQNGQAQQASSRSNGSASSSAQQIQQLGPVPPSADMYDPRLLVDIIKSGGRDIERAIVFHPSEHK